MTVPLRRMSAQRVITHPGIHGKGDYMQLTAPVKRITNSKPFYALAGIGDYATVELPRRAREVYDDLAARGRRMVSRTSGQAAHGLERVSGQAAHGLERVSGQAAQELKDVGETAKHGEVRESPGREPTRRTTTPKR